MGKKPKYKTWSHRLPEESMGESSLTWPWQWFLWFYTIKFYAFN
jgi:hypothetical protein